MNRKPIKVRDSKPKLKFYSKYPEEQKFFERHVPFVRVKREYLFSDGASCVDSVDGFQNLEGPNDKTEYEKAKTIRRYFEKLASDAQAAFFERKIELKQEAQYVNAEEAVEELTALRQKAMKYAAKLREAKAAEDATEPRLKAQNRLKQTAADTRDQIALQARLDLINL